MRQHLWKLVSVLALLALFDFEPAVAGPVPPGPVGAAFTYQGLLSNGGGPANGSYDFTFTLFNETVIGPTQVGLTQTVISGSVSPTAFSLRRFDFGPVFNGNDAWLSVGVRTNGAGGFTPLNPMQEITPTPYALYSPNAGVASTASLPVPLSALPGAVITNGESTVNIAGNFTGNGGSLTNLSENSLVPTSTMFPVQTNNYFPQGINTFTVPPLVTSMVVKLWGAGGGTSILPIPPNQYVGGGGGPFSTVTLNVTAGQTYTFWWWAKPAMPFWAHQMAADSFRRMPQGGNAQGGTLRQLAGGAPRDFIVLVHGVELHHRGGCGRRGRGRDNVCRRRRRQSRPGPRPDRPRRPGTMALEASRRLAVMANFGLSLQRLRDWPHQAFPNLNGAFGIGGNGLSGNGGGGGGYGGGAGGGLPGVWRQWRRFPRSGYRLHRFTSRGIKVIR